ncbi:MAG: zeta toxin family protein [Campylobacteraceae bacterium]|jgi:predicted ABC-type ATPase|nr:zeta toxin family protein [Campylobacteraceae bacterium]
MTDKKPNLTFMAGVNGAGKSTLCEHYIFSKIPIINPDVIAKERNCSIVEAGKIAINNRKNMLDSKKSFVIETTLAGNGEINFMKVAKECGYKINLVYIGVSDALISFMRVKNRVEKGGHDVPTKDIMRRYSRSLDNLIEALQIADRAYIFDNSFLKRSLLCAKNEDGKIIIKKDLPKWVENIQSKGKEMAADCLFKFF